MFKSLPIATAGCIIAVRCFVRRFSGALPSAGQPLLIAANHCSLFDGVGLCTELTWRTRRPMHPLVTADAFANPLFGWCLRCTNAIPLDRGDHASTVAALHTALGYLARGEAVTIFPEGHLNNGQNLRLPRPGMALLALESGAPILPCGLRGTAEAFPVDARPRLRRCVEIILGEPVPTAELSARYHGAPARERQRLVDGLSSLVMNRIAGLSGLRPHRRMPPPQL